MSKLSEITESIWSDMQDRSAGEEIRKEDDINLLDSDGLYDYINKNYKRIAPFAFITNIGGMLSVPIIRGTVHNCVWYSPESEIKAVSIGDGMISQVDGLLNLLYDNFSIKEINGKRDDDEYRLYWLSPKDGSEITNKFFIDVIDFLLENIPNSPNYKKSIKKIEN